MYGKKLTFTAMIVFTITFYMMPGASLFAGPQDDWSRLNEQAAAFFEQEKFEEAVSKAVDSVNFAKEHFGDRSPQTIISIFNLADFYFELGYPDEAMPLYEESYRLAIAVLGEHHPDTLMIASGLADLYSEEGRFAQAQPLLEKIVAGSRETLGEENPDTLTAMTRLAQIYESQGQYEKSEDLLRQALILYEKTLGVDHPETLATREKLASVFRTQGRFADAEPLYQLILEKKTKLLGEKDRETVFTMGNLAELYRRMAKYEESEALFIKAIALIKAIAGDQDPDLYEMMGNLAQLYQNKGQYPQAETYFKQVWEFDRQTLGDKHPNTIVDLNNLAGIYRAQGFYGQAEDAYQTSLRDIVEALGEKHPESISIMNNLALVLENEGLFDKAEPLFKSALRNSESLLGQNHPTTLALMNNLASLYESQGDFKKSEPLYLATIQLNEAVYGKDHPNTIAGVNNLGYLYLVQQDYERAEPLFSRVLTIWEAQLGERHQKTLKALNNLARVYHKQGKLEAADSMFARALRLRKEVLGDKHPDVVRSMVDISGLYISQNRDAEAEKLLLETIALSEEVLGDKHQYTFEAMSALAELYEKTGQLDKALSTRLTAFDRRTEFFERVLWAAGENTRQAYIELHKPEQDRFLALLAKTNNSEAARLALHASLKRKGLLLKISSEINKIIQMTQSPELAAKAQTLNSKRKELASLTLSGPTTETPEAFRIKTAALEEELYELQAELGRASLIYHVASQRVSLDKVFDNLGGGDVLVDFLTYDDNGLKIMAIVAQSDSSKCFVWWECKNNRIEMIPLGDLEPIAKAITYFREAIQNEDAEEEELLETGNTVFARIWKPLQAVIGNKKSIYIVPDSALHLLPMDAMIDDNGNYMVQGVDLKILSSSRDLVVSALPDAQGDFMIMAGPDYNLDDARIKSTKVAIKGNRSAVSQGIRVASHGLRSLSFGPLDGAELEGKTIKNVSDSFAKLEGAEEEGKGIQKVAAQSQAKAVIFLQKEAEEQQLRTFHSAPKMLHVATHGFFLQGEERLKKRLLSLNRGGTLMAPPPGDNPLLRAGLAFAGINSNAPFLGEIDTDNDGVLTAMEVLSLNLAGTQLVVLSACETGVGEIHAGEGVYGLRRAFQEAGVKSVVNSLWPVSDEGTRRLMTEFYTQLFKGVPARKALKTAQLALLQTEWNHPYYWAAFVLVERRFSASY
ncbi:tetratricopeptide repeat protein [bacterium]|nr:tetratricopeptide repeat protein [bacterium]